MPPKTPNKQTKNSSRSQKSNSPKKVTKDLKTSNHAPPNIYTPTIKTTSPPHQRHDPQANNSTSSPNAQQKSFPLQKLPQELIHMIISHLEPHDSLCLGVTSRTFYNIHFEKHKRVPLELNAENILPSPPTDRSTIHRSMKTKQTLEEKYRQQENSVLPKPLLTPPIHAFFPRDKRIGSISHAWGVVRIFEYEQDGAVKIRREVKMMKEYMGYYYRGGHPPNMEPMPRCACFLFLPRSSWCGKCQKCQEESGHTMWEWMEGDGTGRIVSFICGV